VRQRVGVGDADDVGSVGRVDVVVAELGQELRRVGGRLDVERIVVVVADDAGRRRNVIVDVHHRRVIVQGNNVGGRRGHCRRRYRRRQKLLVGRRRLRPEVNVLKLLTAVIYECL